MIPIKSLLDFTLSGRWQQICLLFLVSVIKWSHISFIVKLIARTLREVLRDITSTFNNSQSFSCISYFTLELQYMLVKLDSSTWLQGNTLSSDIFWVPYRLLIIVHSVHSPIVRQHSRCHLRAHQFNRSWDFGVSSIWVHDRCWHLIKHILGDFLLLRCLLSRSAFKEPLKVLN